MGPLVARRNFLTDAPSLRHPFRVSHAPADPHDAESGEHEAHAEPADELAPDEPKTPVWLTALGGALFLVLAIIWLVARATDDAEAAAATASSASASAAVAAPNPPPPPTVVPPPPQPPPAPPPAVAPVAPRPTASAPARYQRKNVKP
jgi:hypothetical protein